MDKEEIRLITKICYMYYYEDEVQSKIAKKFNLTRQMVSRLMQKAKEEGVVKISIESPVKEIIALETQLESKFDLKDAVVIQNDTISDSQLIHKLGKAAGEYFMKAIMSKMQIGIGIGEALEAMAEYINANVFDASLNSIDLIQLIGGVNSNKSFENCQYIMSLIAKKINGNLVFLNAPYIIEDEKIRDAILKGPLFEDVFSAYENLDFAFVEIKPANKVYRASMSESKVKGINYLNLLGINYLNNIDAAGEICLNYFNDRGYFVDTQISDKTVAITQKKLQKVKNLVGIVGGEGANNAALGALRSGLFNVIITDEDTSRYLLSK